MEPAEKTIVPFFLCLMRHNHCTCTIQPFIIQCYKKGAKRCQLEREQLYRDIIRHVHQEYVKHNAETEQCAKCPRFAVYQKGAG